MSLVSIVQSSAVAGIVREKGTDAWFYMDIKDLLPEKHRADADKYRKGTDTMDVWFDSGEQVSLSLLLI